MTIRELREEGRKRLAAAGIEEAGNDARLLLEHALGVDYAGLLMRLGEEAPADVPARYESLIALRQKRIPLQHIVGEAPFLGLSFIVTPDVLIPRSDTEVLAEEALRHCRGARVLDLCTGSGCLAVSLAVLGGCASVTGSDVSEAALGIARKNAEKYGADVRYVKSDLFEKIDGVYDLIVSNPPYIESAEIGRLQPEVRDHDPRLALDGGEDGLSFYRRICREAGAHLAPGGILAVEIGSSQAQEVARLFEENGLSGVRVIRDLSGADRVVTGVYDV
ncbi:MAG: peptide chain release factor N(5)-glutamine methyltransferase [Lachnospiraceae bacterium]|nr:peptide chain release factor N(5)-glutamine methyltransferase [Lachnospiraceae bacterium]